MESTATKCLMLRQFFSIAVRLILLDGISKNVPQRIVKRTTVRADTVHSVSARANHKNTPKKREKREKREKGKRE